MRMECCVVVGWGAHVMGGDEGLGRGLGWRPPRGEGRGTEAPPDCPRRLKTPLKTAQDAPPPPKAQDGPRPQTPPGLPPDPPGLKDPSGTRTQNG